jgi:hypothetical protein
MTMNDNAANSGRVVRRQRLGGVPMRLGYGYVTSRRGMHLQGDPRDIALRQALPSPRRVV